MSESICDDYTAHPTLNRERVFEGHVWDVVRDRADLGAKGGRVTREYLWHPGAVAVLAIDENFSVLLIRQYRHPAKATMWELPAGLLDIADEAPDAAAARELTEETGYAAERLDVLVDLLTSPGGTDETLRVFLARGVAPLSRPSDFVRTGEEADIETRWVPLDDVCSAALSGRIANGTLLAAAFAAQTARGGGFADLRPADADWPSRVLGRRGDPTHAPST